MIRVSTPASIEIKQNIDAAKDTIYADPTQIHQIMMNLCTNATHAMQEKGGVLEICQTDVKIESDQTCRYGDLNRGEYLLLSVSDTGPGINPDIIDRIFEPYFTTKGSGVGTGMGLAVIHGIVKSYGGNIIVESKPVKGTTFSVIIPKIAAEELPPEREDVEIPGGSESILFVDDEKDALDAVQPMLERLGYRVTARKSSIEALEALRHKPAAFDLVITDQTMPNMTGKDLAKELMDIRQDIPIILCTGFSDRIDEKKAKELGIKAFVMKPILMGQIAATIREVLDKE